MLSSLFNLLLMIGLKFACKFSKIELRSTVTRLLWTPGIFGHGGPSFGGHIERVPLYTRFVFHYNNVIHVIEFHIRVGAYGHYEI